MRFTSRSETPSSYKQTLTEQIVSVADCVGGGLGRALAVSRWRVLRGGLFFFFDPSYPLHCTASLSLYARYA